MKSLPKLLFLIALLAPVNLLSQQFIYRAGFFGFFDNREYFNDFVNDQTIFGTRISGEIGYSFNSRNRIMAGLDYLYEFGSKGEWIAPDFTAYYNGRNEHWNLWLGAFPRINKLSMPFALMSDTIPYYRPNVEGILLEYNSNNGFRQNIWIDWNGRQSYTRNESFLLGFSGYLKKNIFLYQHHFVMTHFAHTLNGTGEHIRDNGAITLLPGLDLSNTLPLDTLSLSAGILASYDRIRDVYDFSFPVGFLAVLDANYRGFGFKGTLYAGESQVITSGDGFYKSDFYGRTDFFYQKTTSNISGRVQFSMHFIPGVMDLSMMLVVRASLDGIFARHQSN
jgi:hypothetical protein